MMHDKIRYLHFLIKTRTNVHVFPTAIIRNSTLSVGTYKKKQVFKNCTVPMEPLLKDTLNLQYV